MKHVLIFVFCLVIYLNIVSLEKVVYNLTNDPIDVVIPCHKKDRDTLEYAIQGARYYVTNSRRVIVVSSERFTESTEWIPEKLFPFTKFSVALEILGSEKMALDYLNAPGTRIGWIYQQLLKLYAISVIPNISSNVLVLDADTFFIKKTTFLDDNNAGLFNIVDQHFEPYFEHVQRLLNITRVFPEYSGITNHMLFQKPVIEDLMKLIKQKHNMEPWKAICKCIDPNHLIDDSCMSEYEIYFNFCFMRSDQFKIRKLHYSDEIKFEELIQFTQLNKYGLFSRLDLDLEFDYVSCHYRLLPGDKLN